MSKKLLEDNSGHRISDKVGTFTVIVGSALTMALAIVVYGLTDPRHPLRDLVNGMPERGQLGYGKFEIYGVTFPFEYPFRLLHRRWLSIIVPWSCYIVHQVL